MQLKTTLKLNERTTIETIFEGENLEAVIQEAAPILDFKGVCGMCGSNNIKLNVRKSKDGKYTYTMYTCNDCGGTQPFGKLQTGGYFLKPWQEKYTGNDQQA